MYGENRLNLKKCDLIVEKKMDPRLAAKVCSENPGEFVNQFLPSLKKIDKRFNNFGLGFGKLEKGFSANFTVLNLKVPTLVSKENLKTKVAYNVNKWSHAYYCTDAYLVSVSSTK